MRFRTSELVATGAATLAGNVDNNYRMSAQDVGRQVHWAWGLGRTQALFDSVDLEAEMCRVWCEQQPRCRCPGSTHA